MLSDSVPSSENSHTHSIFLRSISVRCPFLIGESPSFPLFRRRHCHPIAPAFTPIATKGARVSALLMERRAKKSDCRATTSERANTSLFFPRRRRLVIVCTARNPIPPSFIISPRHPHRTPSRRRFPYSHLSRKYHDYFNSH